MTLNIPGRSPYVTAMTSDVTNKTPDVTDGTSDLTDKATDMTDILMWQGGLLMWHTGLLMWQNETPGVTDEASYMTDKTSDVTDGTFDVTYCTRLWKWQNNSGDGISDVAWGCWMWQTRLLYSWRDGYGDQQDRLQTSLSRRRSHKYWIIMSNRAFDLMERNPDMEWQDIWHCRQGPLIWKINWYDKAPPLAMYDDALPIPFVC